MTRYSRNRSSPGTSSSPVPGIGPHAARSTESTDVFRFASTLSHANESGEIAILIQAFLQRQFGRTSARMVDPTSTDHCYPAVSDGHRSDEFDLSIEVAPNGELFASVQLIYRRRLYGSLEITFKDTDALTLGDRDLLRLVAFTVAGELARIANTATLDEHVRDLNLVKSIEQKISHAPTVQAIGDIVKDELSQLVDCTFFAFLVTDDEPETLACVAYRNLDDADRIGFRVPVVGSRAGEVFRTGESRISADILLDDNAYGRETADWRSLMIAPLISGQDTFGTMMVGHQLPSLYGERDLRIVELTATHVANAIYHLVEEERTNTLYRAAIEALSAAVDARDPMTHTHSQRVAELGKRVAEEIGLPESDVELIELAGLLHDIGKIGIPDRILTKPGPLDAQERLIMMSHADLGARIVESSPALQPLAPMVRFHHEWFDGRGYPDGLRGDGIPVSAAILSVVDALETMTSDRVYRSALPLDQARAELLRGRGDQFHPRIVDVVVELLDTDLEVRELLGTGSGNTPDSPDVSPIQIADVADVRILTRIASEIGTLTDLSVFLDHVHSIVRDELDLADVAIWLLNSDGATYSLAAGEIDLPPPGILKASDVWQADNYEASGGAIALTRDFDSGLHDRTVVVPMYVEDSLIGLIELVLYAPGQVDARDIDLLQAIAGPVASTVRVAQLHDAAKRAATTDGLTGVLNHRAFYDRLDAMMVEPGGFDHVSLLIVDVIGLKAINDNHGHLTGDSVLKAVARALVDRLSDDDIVARYGGDEFAAIIRNRGACEAASIIAEIEKPVLCVVGPGSTLDVRLRCGFASSMTTDDRASELVARADSLLYQRIRPTSRVVADQP